VADVKSVWWCNIYSTTALSVVAVAEDRVSTDKRHTGPLSK